MHTTRNLVTICRCGKLLIYYNYIPFAVHYIPGIFNFLIPFIFLAHPHTSRPSPLTTDRHRAQTLPDSVSPSPNPQMLTMHFHLHTQEVPIVMRLKHFRRRVLTCLGISMATQSSAQQASSVEGACRVVWMLLEQSDSS